MYPLVQVSKHRLENNSRFRQFREQRNSGQCLPGSVRFIFILSSSSRGNDGDREQWESWSDFH